MRSIKFPTKVDSICFLNPRGDLLVSHATKVSQIKFTAYWNKVFDYYGITDSKLDGELKFKAQ